MLAPFKEKAECHSLLQIAYTKMVLLDPGPTHENKVTQPLETQFTCCVSMVWLLPDANTMLFYFPTSKTMNSFSNLTSKPEWGEITRFQALLKSLMQLVAAESRGITLLQGRPDSLSNSKQSDPKHVYTLETLKRQKIMCISINTCV